MSWDDALALRVVAIEALSPTLRRVSLSAADGGELPTAPPGAHIFLTLNADGRIIRNAYSLVSPPHDRRRYDIIVRRVSDGRGGSAFVHDVLRPGDVVTAAWPANLFPLDSRAHRYLLISGGIGITPMLSYLPVLVARGVPFELHHVCRADERAAFAELLAPYAGVHIHSGRAGFDLDAILVRQRLGTHLAACGPRALMDTLFDRARALGWPDSNLHRESFGAEGGVPLRVTLARSGRAIEVAADQTILEALEAAGLTPNCLCRGGACGACLTVVLDGEPEHRDDFLDDEDKQSGRMMMICVSRARGPALVLDV